MNHEHKNGSDQTEPDSLTLEQKKAILHGAPLKAPGPSSYYKTPTPIGPSSPYKRWRKRNKLDKDW